MDPRALRVPVEALEAQDRAVHQAHLERQARLAQAEVVADSDSDVLRTAKEAWARRHNTEPTNRAEGGGRRRQDDMEGTRAKAMAGRECQGEGYSKEDVPR